MILTLGFTALVLAFLSALYAALTALMAANRPSPSTAASTLRQAAPREVRGAGGSASAQDARWLASARNAAFITWPLLTLVALSLITLLVTNHFEVGYVSQVTSLSMPVYLKVTALWGGQAGSLVFWSWLMSTFAGIAMLRNWDRDRELMPYVIAATMVTLAFFIGLILFLENPFRQFWQKASGEIVTAMFQPAGTVLYFPGDGHGLNPLLRHPGMIIHPPMLYTGFVSFVIPFAFAFAALVTGRTDSGWIRTTRRWTLVGWLFLSMGLVLGGRWAYDVLGWGGYWGWDPVEIAAFMPWLVGTAFLHSVMIQEKRGMLKRWNMLLIILTYDLVIFGTFLTRSGVLSSVHAFAQSSIGPVFFAFIALTFGVSVALLLKRWDALKDENHLETWLSREAVFLLNNLLFLSIALTCFYGVIAPLISELLTGTKITLGPSFFQATTGPLFGGLVLLMGVAPLMAWRKASAKALGKMLWVPFGIGVLTVIVLMVTGIVPIQNLFTAPLADGYGNSAGPLWAALLGFFFIVFTGATTILEFWRGALARTKTVKENFFTALLHLIGRNRRRYGGYIIHLGVVFIAMGVIGSGFFKQETQGTLTVGQTLALGPYVMRYDGLQQWDAPDDRQVTRATVSLLREGRVVAELHPRKDYYYAAQQPMSIAGLYPSLNSTLYDSTAFVRAVAEADFYVLIVGWEPVGLDGATFKIYYNPLINWLWSGALIFILGTLVAAWPDWAEEKRTVVAQRQVTAVSGAD